MNKRPNRLFALFERFLPTASGKIIKNSRKYQELERNLGQYQETVEAKNQEISSLQAQIKQSQEVARARVQEIRGLQAKLENLGRKHRGMKKMFGHLRDHLIDLELRRGDIDLGEYEPDARDVIQRLEERLDFANSRLDNAVRDRLTLRKGQARDMHTFVQLFVNAVPAAEKAAWFYIGNNGKVSYASPRLEKVAGIKPEDIEGKNFSQLLSGMRTEDSYAIRHAWKDGDTSYHTIAVGEKTDQKLIDIQTQKLMGCDEEVIGTAVYIKPHKGFGRLTPSHHNSIRNYLRSLAQRVTESYSLERSATILE